MFKKVQGLIKSISKQEYAKASVYYVVANVIGQGVVLLSSGFFTRAMSKEEYGLVSTYSTWVLVINTFICLNLFITVRNAYIDYKEDYDGFVSSVLLLNILSGICFTIMIACINAILGLGFGMAELLLACLQSVSLNLVNVYLATTAMKNEYRGRAVFMVAPNVVHVVLSIILVLLFTGNLYLSKIAGNAFGIFAFGVISCVILFKKAFPRIILKYWKYALRISLPSVFHTLSDLILMQCDRLMLTAMVGAEETAEYSIIYTVSSIIVAIYVAVNGAWTPWFFNKASKGEKKDTRRIHGYYLLGFSLFTAAMMTIAPEIIKLISPSEYWEGIGYVAPLVVASYLIFLLAFFSGYLMLQKRTGVIALNTVIAAVLNLVLNYLLIPYYKSYGAVVATVISYVILFVLHYVASGKEGRSFFNIKAMWINLFAVIVYGCLFSLVCDWWGARYALFAVASLAAYFAAGRRYIKEFLTDKKMKD